MTIQNVLFSPLVGGFINKTLKFVSKNAVKNRVKRNIHATTITPK